jgi:hypothetical protein
MVLYIASLLITFLLWDYSLEVNLSSLSYKIPLPVIIFCYLVSIYIMMRLGFLWNKISSKGIEMNQKSLKAEEKCIEAMVAFVGGDIEEGQKIWEEAARYLEKDTLFLLLSIINGKYLPEYSKLAAHSLSKGGGVLRNFFTNYTRYKDTLSFSALLEMANNFNLPWVFEQLIDYYLKQGMIKEAKDSLKKFHRSGKLSANLWKKLMANIFYAEANLSDSGSRYNLWKKANRLEPTVAVYELANYYKSHNLSKARSLIEVVWPIEPSMRLGRLYIEMDDTDTIIIHKFQHARKLANFNPQSPVSNLLLATYAMESNLLSIASDALKIFSKHYPEIGNILFARLEAKKNNDVKAWENIEQTFTALAKKANLDIESIV